MRIAVNTRLLLKERLEGLGTFTHEILQRMVRRHPEHTFYFFFDRAYDPSFIYAPNVEPVVIGPQARHPVLYYLWFEWSVASALRRVQADLFLSPDGYLSLRSPVKQVPVIHDLNFHYFPEFFDSAHRWHYLRYFPKYARKAERIATVSEFSRQDIVKWYGIDPDRIDVVYNGTRQDALTLTDAEKAEVRTVYSHAQPYFIFIGALYPRKNLLRQLQAFDRFKKQTGLPHKFLLVGNAHKEAHAVAAAVQSLEYGQDVVLLGRVEPREQVDRLLAASEGLMYVSLFEGFGLPILEAMRCQVPVITGNVSAMPEIAGNGALLCDPENVEEMAGAMQRLATDTSLAMQLVENGRQILPRYTWEDAEERLWRCMMQAAGHAAAVEK